MSSGALSDGWTGLSHEGSQSLSVSWVYNFIVHKIIVYLQNFYTQVHARPVSPGTVQQIVLNSGTQGYLEAWTLVSLTAPKFETFIFCVLGFALACILNIPMIMILNELCLFSAYFGYITIRDKIRNVRSNARIGVRLGKLPVGQRTLFCRRCNLNRWLSAANSQTGQA